MKKIYKYSFSRHTLSLTTIYLTIFLALGIGLYFLYEGGYLSAWFFSFIVALVALMSLSIPRRILVDDEGLHILCLLDITELHPEEIASVRQVEKQELRGYVPYFGGYGFFGFYGHYFDLKNPKGSKSTLPNGGTSSKSPISMKIGSMSPVPREKNS